MFVLWFYDFLAQVKREGVSPETVRKLRMQYGALVNVYGLDLKRVRFIDCRRVRERLKLFVQFKNESLYSMINSVVYIG